MNQVVITALKALGVLLLSALIFFLFWPGKQEVKDQATNLALEFLQKRLLAMVPSEHEHEVESKFKVVREQALEGKINDEHLNDFATLVINAEAAGERLGIEKIDSALIALRQNEIAVRSNDKRRAIEAQRLKEWAQRVHDFEKFEKRWQTLVPDSVFKYAETVRTRPLYRISKNFVVQIDSAALAQVISVSVNAPQESLRIVAGAPIPPPTPHVDVLMRHLENDLRDLRVEWRSEHFGTLWADSIRARAKAFSRDTREPPPEIPKPPAPAAQPSPRRD